MRSSSSSISAGAFSRLANSSTSSCSAADDTGTFLPGSDLPRTFGIVRNVPFLRGSYCRHCRQPRLLSWQAEQLPKSAGCAL